MVLRSSEQSVRFFKIRNVCFSFQDCIDFELLSTREEDHEQLADAEGIAMKQYSQFQPYLNGIVRMKRVTESALIELSEGHITNGLLEGFNRKFIMADNKAWIGYFANDLRDGPVMVFMDGELYTEGIYDEGRKTRARITIDDLRENN